jgi:hypothetical protein
VAAATAPVHIRVPIIAVPGEGEQIAA